MTVLGALVSRPRAAIQSTPWGAWEDTQGAYSGQSVSYATSTQLLAVYGCNRFICDGISTLPVDVLRKTADGPQPAPVPRWITEPTVDLDFISWCTQVLTSLLLTGNAFVWKLYSNGTLDQLIPLDPTAVTVFRKNGRKWFRVGDREIDPFNIGHIPGVMKPGADVGLSPIEAAMQDIGLGMAMVEFGGRFFDNSTVLSGVIEVPNELTPGEARDMARAWGRKHSGKSKSHLPGVLQGGAQWKPMGITNEQAQFLESRKYTASQIASQMFLIDPTEMGLPVDGSSITYANLEQRNARKVQVTFLPWIIRIEKFLSDLLAAPRYVKFNVGGLLRGDMATRFNAYRVALGPTEPFMTADEARHFEDWGDMPATALEAP